MSAVRRSVIFSALDKYTQQILLIVTTAVMARLLTPAETGLYVLANSVVLLADNLRTFGVGVYIVKVKDLNLQVLQSAFTVTLMLSVMIIAVFLVAAEPIAAFYDALEIDTLLRLSALAFLFVPFATPIIALLQRELAFRHLAAINITVAVVTCIVTIGLGFLGVGPSSFIWGFITGSVVLTVLAFAAHPRLAIFRPTLRGARDVLSFGSLSSSITVINMAYELMPRLVLGKILGFDAVGLFARAVTVCQIPERAITAALHPVVLPAMAAHVRDGGALKDSYLNGHALVSGVKWPMLAMLAILAEPAVHILLGSQWVAAVPLVQVICLGMIALAPAFMTFPLLVTAGRTRDCLYASLISLPPSVAIIAFAAPYGIFVVAACTLIIAPLQMAVAFAFIQRAVGLTVSEFFAHSKKSAVVLLATVTLPMMVTALSTLDITGTALAIAGGALGWLAAIWAVDHPLKSEIAVVFGLVRQSLRRRPAGLPV